MKQHPPAQQNGSRLRTRKPTGKVPWPMILVAGEAGAGKSYSLAQLSASDKVSDTYWLDLGEGSADEYAVLPGADYAVLEHDGTYGQILEAVLAVDAEAKRVAAAGEPPVVLGIDSGTALWKMLSTWTTTRAARSPKNRRLLQQDPDAEVDVTVNYWNDANKRHRRIIDTLMAMPAITVVTARLKEATVLDHNGRPTQQKEWKPESQKDLPYDATVWVNLHLDGRRAEIIKARSLRVQQPDGKPVPLPGPGLDLEHLVFDVLGCEVGVTGGRDMHALAESLYERAVDEVERLTDENALREVWEMTKDKVRPEQRAALSTAVTERLAAIRGDDAQDGEPTDREQQKQRLRAVAQQQTHSPDEASSDEEAVG